MGDEIGPAPAETRADNRNNRAVTNYYRFSVFNVISFTFLAGNVIVLYALRFHASTVVVGLIGASYQVNMLFTLFGRYVVPRVGPVRTFGLAWIVRYIFMLPVLVQISRLSDAGSPSMR